jgi:hypothetical protein
MLLAPFLRNNTEETLDIHVTGIFVCFGPGFGRTLGGVDERAILK